MKKKILKNSLWKGIAVTVLQAIVTIETYAQTMNPLNQSGWTLMEEKNNIAMYYQTATCGNEPYILIRIINKSKHNAAVEWSLEKGSLKNKFAILAQTDRIGTCPSNENHAAINDLAESIPEGKTIYTLHPNFNIH